jgi:hypothetical protein
MPVLDHIIGPDTDHSFAVGLAGVFCGIGLGFFLFNAKQKDANSKETPVQPRDPARSLAYKNAVKAQKVLTQKLVPALDAMAMYYEDKPESYSRHDDLAYMPLGDHLENVLYEFKTAVQACAHERPVIGLLNPQPYMKKYIDELRTRFDIRIITPDETNFSPDYIKLWAQLCRDQGINYVCGLAQKDSWHHALINRELGHVSISALAYLISMNKYMQRTIEPKPFWFTACDPMTEDDEDLIKKVTDANEWPCMLKNTSLSLGRGVFRIKTPEDLKRILVEYRQNQQLQAGIKHTNDSITQYFTGTDDEYLNSPPIYGQVPPFLFEHCVDLSLGWIEYCYEGAITEEGQLVHYGFTEELYDTDAVGLAYITPPPSLQCTPKLMDKLEKYVEGYMKGLIDRGYRRQFFNIEIWGRTFQDELGQQDVEFCFCEINPRCAHAYHIPYQIAYGTNLWGDNFNLVLYNKMPDVSPWTKWKTGNSDVSVQVLINIQGHEGKQVSDILDYHFIDYIEKHNKVELVRHVKHRDYTITADDAASGAGCTLLQIFQRCRSQAEAAVMEQAIRKMAYKPECKPDFEYPEWWIALGAKFGYSKAQDCLTQGFSPATEGQMAVGAHVKFGTKD